ncbi:glycosyltransferase [Sabulicella glaciei]|uniref:Glycosyltransferase n=1 Tax=Sabulicella glaciei TaxID=2984948 RepID=A0ABT3P0N8_9PROT|nr:glycosyltransferase [Roseococcus sp. MDT2-1-1]MCW8087935.1 glycosyltransferase [Roseococcus sp. MDT2-1-1]
MGEAALFLDVSGLIGFFRGHRAPMGMARVQMALLDAGLEPPALFQPVAFARAGELRRVDPAALRPVLDAAGAGGPTDDPEWLAALTRLHDSLDAAPAPAIASGDRLFFPGPGGAEDFLRLRPWQEEAGARLAVLFHDALPLSLPEHVPPDLVQDFGRFFGVLCLGADRVIAVSEHARREFLHWQRRFLPALEIPAGVLRLDATLPDPPPEDLPAPLDDRRRFVLCVATLESRKDHAFLLRAWRTLIRRHGEVAVPDLVLAGREGFGAEAALRLLAQAPELRRKVHWLRDLGDGALAALRRAALLCVFNSFGEGWGLPVTEALAAGRLVLTPDHTSLREAGGEAGLYFAPGEEESFLSLLWPLCADDAHREATERRLLPRLRLRSWREVAEALREDLLREEAPPPPLERAPLALGWRLPFKAPLLADGLPEPGALLPFFLREGEGWAAAEGSGVWLLDPPEGGAPPRLRLRLPDGLQQPRLFLEAAAPPAPVTLGLRVRVASGEASPWREMPLAPSEDRLLVVDLPPLPAGDALVEFDTSGSAVPPGEVRRLNAQLRAVMLCEVADHASQLRFLLEFPRCRHFPA